MKFSEQDVEQAKIWGEIRQNESRNNSYDDIPTDQGAWVHAIGVLGEMMYARYMGIEYEFTVNTYKNKADVTVDGQGYEVKTTTKPAQDAYFVIADNEHDPLVFVRLEMRNHEAEIIGGIYPNDLKQVLNVYGYRTGHKTAITLKNLKPYLWLIMPANHFMATRCEWIRPA